MLRKIPVGGRAGVRGDGAGVRVGVIIGVAAGTIGTALGAKGVRGPCNSDHITSFIRRSLRSAAAS